MRRAAILALLITVAVCQQTPPAHVSSDEAAKHLIKEIPPEYPELAKQARIQGNILLEISIDESGAALVRGLISGHPMLVQAAVKAVNQWKYRPFEFDGKPAPVFTYVVVSFGDLAKNGGATARADVLFWDACIAALDSARTALAKADYTAADELLKKGKELVPTEDAHVPHCGESWQWMTTMGQLRRAQKQYDEAEQYLKNALALGDNGRFDKDSPELAASLGNLGSLYAEEKKSGLAREKIGRSVAIYEKNFKRAGVGDPEARQAYGQAVAYQYWTLIDLAKERNDTRDMEAQCHRLLDFQEFLRLSDRNAYVSACRQEPPAPNKP